ncbi:DUF1735 domain-containing protein [uncultured Alistipes sp.]|jgi:hypothetical protein|uniref:BT_3987 domain-containing protein n=1 Tax=uncultured Alistipes sp. TaxID=538949 RepID=UPI0025F5770E|nr:DUF1735 domain-containing protein [uncultured Alistipes sp.]
MKNILKYAFAAVAIFAGLTACEEIEDFDKTVGAAPNLVYANTGSDNLYKVRIVHRPEASTGEFSAKFGVNCNTTRHAASKVDIVYDASLVAEYNADHNTSYTALPKDYLTLENTTLTLPEGAQMTADSVTVTLTGNLAMLTEREYLAPLRIRAQGIDASSVQGVVYVAVETEINLIRPITATDQMVGFPATGRTAWSADCASPGNLFDGNTSTSSSFKGQYNNVLNIDMNQTQLVTGLLLGTGSAPAVSIEYSTDGVNFSQAGTPVSGEYVTASSMMYIAFQGHIEARYLRLKINFSSSYSLTLSEVNIYMIDSTDPTVYALTGTETPVTGKITHKKGAGSTSNLNASFKVYATQASQSGYSVTAAADNSLVAAYNTANGTSYATLPAANLKLENTPATIASGAFVSDTEIKVTLTGDLTALTNKTGYLVPLKLSTSGAAISTSRGVVYVAVSVENNVIRPISSVDDLIGFPATGRASWSANCSNPGNLFDGSNSTSVSFSSSGNVLVVDMQQARLVTGLHFYTYGFSSLSIEYSTDGTTYETAGTPVSGEFVYTGSTWSAGNYYVAVYDYIEARYLRLSFGYSGYYYQTHELNVYELESEDPMVYTICGTDNVLTGSIAHTPAGSFNGVNAAFNCLATVSSTSGYSVSAVVDNSLIAAYNREHTTSYVALDASLVKFENVPCMIAAGQNKSATQIKVSLDGDLTSLTDNKGYLIPLQLTSPDAVVSAGRGVVYVIVTPVQELFRKNFTEGDIEGTLVADRSAWTITGDSFHSGSWENLLDGDESTFLRPWGSPLSWTIDMKQEYEMTGVRVTARSDYSGYQPSAVLVEYSDNGEDYVELGTATTANGDLVRFGSSSAATLYGSQKMRYIRITATYGSNMGVGEFNIYTK